MMIPIAMNPVLSPAIQCIQSGGVSGFIGRVQGGSLSPALAFSAVGAALDRYVGSTPSRDYPRELSSLVKGLPEGVISSDLQGRVLGLINDHGVVVEKAARIYAINAEAPFALPAEWRWIPAGEFQMGSARDDKRMYYDDPEFLGTVYTSGFFMLDHPVTNAEFRTFLKATKCEDLRDLIQRFAGDCQPAVEVTHVKAATYSQWLGKTIAKTMGISVIGRLPTEEEWEKAAKGPGGNEFISPATREQAHFNADTTRDVNHRDAYANGYGLKDMMGNVWEWTSSPWELTFVSRGDCWYRRVSPRTLRAAYRGVGYPVSRSHNIGLRPVLVPQDSKG